MTGEFEGKDLAEKYEVGALIRRGEIGDFYRGRHMFMDRPVMLRIVPRALAVDDNIVRRFFDEAKTSSRINHPNVLNVIDFGSASDGVVYAVYEGENGETLQEIIRNSGKLDAVAATDISTQAAKGLSAIHSQGMVHGNLTPENILIANDGLDRPHVKLFGIGSAGPMAATRNGEMSGSDFAYLAPEQCSGADQADARSDVYSLGAIAYEMLAGEPPFSGERPSDVMLKHTEEAPPPLSAFRHDLSPAIEPVLLKALAKDPELRYQTAGEFADDLTRVSEGQPALAGAPTGGEANNIWKTAFIVLAGISLLSVFLIYATSSKQTNPTMTLQPDANGQPVQPINPATGAEEQNLAAMPGMMPEVVGNSNSSSGVPGTAPGGDGYNPWATGAPPAGAPAQTYTAPGGATVNIPPGQSPFMQDLPSGCSVTPSGLVLCPVPVTTPKPTPTPKLPAANANTSTAPVATPTPAVVRPSPTPAATRTPNRPPANKPTATGDSPSEP
jgi:serine/threonine protein kinase